MPAWAPGGTTGSTGPSFLPSARRHVHGSRPEIDESGRWCPRGGREVGVALAFPLLVTRPLRDGPPFLQRQQPATLHVAAKYCMGSYCDPDTCCSSFGFCCDQQSCPTEQWDRFLTVVRCARCSHITLHLHSPGRAGWGGGGVGCWW